MKYYVIGHSDVMLELEKIPNFFDEIFTDRKNILNKYRDMGYGFGMKKMGEDEIIFIVNNDNIESVKRNEQK